MRENTRENISINSHAQETTALQTTVFLTSIPRLLSSMLKSLNTELNPICHLPALLGARHILHVSRVRVNGPDFPVFDHSPESSTVLSQCMATEAAMFLA